jgi:hypothetical protein
LKALKEETNLPIHFPRYIPHRVLPIAFWPQLLGVVGVSMRPWMRCRQYIMGSIELCAVTHVTPAS